MQLFPFHFHFLQLFQNYLGEKMCYGAKIATQQLFSQLLFLFYNFCFIRSFKLSTILLPDTTFSVSAAKAFFEAAKRPEVRQAAVAAAKNPFVRDVAKSAAKNPETRNQLIAALEKQYGSKGGDTR